MGPAFPRKISRTSSSLSSRQSETSVPVSDSWVAKALCRSTKVQFALEAAQNPAAAGPYSRFSFLVLRELYSTIWCRRPHDTRQRSTKWQIRVIDDQFAPAEAPLS